MKRKRKKYVSNKRIKNYKNFRENLYNFRLEDIFLNKYDKNLEVLKEREKYFIRLKMFNCIGKDIMKIYICSIFVKRVINN